MPVGPPEAPLTHTLPPGRTTARWRAPWPSSSRPEPHASLPPAPPPPRRAGGPGVPWCCARPLLWPARAPRRRARRGGAARIGPLARRRWRASRRRGPRLSRVARAAVALGRLGGVGDSRTTLADGSALLVAQRRGGCGACVVAPTRRVFCLQVATRARRGAPLRARRLDGFAATVRGTPDALLGGALPGRPRRGAPGTPAATDFAGPLCFNTVIYVLSPPLCCLRRQFSMFNHNCISRAHWHVP